MSTTVVRGVADAAGVRRRGLAAENVWLQPLRYWHLLSLDAPAVAAVWMLAFCMGMGARQHLKQAVALFLAVWLMYVADRLLDARRAGGSLEARHRFHARHARRFVCVWSCVATLLAVLLTQVAAPVRSDWLWLSLPLLGYALAVHMSGSRTVPKEWIVAGMFALATVLPAAAGGWHAGLWVGALLFGGLCLLNCIAIARWEHADVRGVPRWDVTQFRRACFSLAMIALVAAAWLPRVPALACGLSAMLLCVLDRLSGKVEAVALRAWVDAALLTPVLVGVFLR